MNCPNCHKQMSCGCQKRVASDGKTVCSSCQSSYEAKLKQNKNPGSPLTGFIKPK